MEHTNQIQWPGWETVGLIGCGNFGAEYEIQRAVRGRTEHATLKVITIPTNKSEISELRAEGYDDASITQYFADSLERIKGLYAKMAGMRGHPNIVYCEDLHAVQHEDGIGWDIYIKMELLTPLREQFREEYPDEQSVIRLGIDLCQALNRCKELSVIHGDIKPANIFISPDGNYKLGDIGLDKEMRGITSPPWLGTYDYMAPEVYNNQPYHTEADVYSLGIVLYWLLNECTIPFVTKKRPTPSEKMEARWRRFSGEALPAPMHGSKALKAIVLKACAYDPKERYVDPADMKRELEAELGRMDEPIDDMDCWDWAPYPEELKKRNMRWWKRLRKNKECKEWKAKQ